MHLPQTAEYALRAVIHIAARQHAVANGALRVEEIATALAVPRNYLAKTLNQLARAGVLASTRGPHGGFRLAVPAGALSFGRVVGVFGSAPARRCLLGAGLCGARADCPVHERWRPVAEGVTEYFATTTIADAIGAAWPSLVGAGVEEGRPRVSPSSSSPRRSERQEPFPL